MEKAEKPALQQNKMGTMKEAPLIINMALPMIASMLVQALYNIVDSLYVARISESALTALSLAFPVQNVQIGLATGIAVGVNSLFSKSLGERNSERANRCAGNGIILMLVAVAALILFGIFGSRPFFEMQSKVPATVNGGAVYVSICTIFCLGSFAEILFERLLQASGRTVLSMITQTTGAVINIIFDPIFIFGWFGFPKMGVAGAAVATVLGQWVAALLAFIFNIKFNPDVKFGKQYLKPEKVIIRPILIVGVPSAIMMAIGAVMNFGMNHILQGFTETATGVFGVYYKLQSFFFMPMFGLNNATISIAAFNYGARRPDRIKKTMIISCGIGVGIMLLGLAVFQILPAQLLYLFKPSREFLSIGKSALRIISIHFPVAAVCIICGGIFQALGNGLYSTVVSICRQMVVLLPAAYLLSLAGKVNAVWWAFPIAEVMSLIVTMICLARIWRKKIKPLYGDDYDINTHSLPL